MALVATTKTPVSLDAYARAIHEARPELSKAACGVLWAQYAIETGRGAACWNWNLGNVKVTEAQAKAGVDYFMLANTWEIINGKKVVFQPPHPATWFRSFPNLTVAMKDHIDFLSIRRYASSWPFVQAGDVEGFAKALKDKGYYTAPLELYASNMRSLHSEWMRSKAWELAKGQVTARTEASPDNASEWPRVQLGSTTWLVAPRQIGPVGIGEGAALARAYGCEIPTRELVDAIWQAADRRIAPITRSVANGLLRDYGASMSSAETCQDQIVRIEAAIGDTPYTLVAGAFKDIIVTPDGKLGLYGWHSLAGVPAQPIYTGHAAAWKDYSQGIRFVRRAT